MRVIGTRRETGDPVPDGVAEAHGPSALPALLPRRRRRRARRPAHGETRGMIGAAELARMKPSAWLVNVARGKLVDERRSSTPWSAGRLRAPPSTSSSTNRWRPRARCGRCRTCLLTPHVAGFREDYWEAATALFAANLRRYLARRSGWRTSSTKWPDTERTGVLGGRKGAVPDSGVDRWAGSGLALSPSRMRVPEPAAPPVATLAELPFYLAERFDRPVLLRRCVADGFDEYLHPRVRRADPGVQPRTPPAWASSPATASASSAKAARNGRSPTWPS